MIFLRFAARVPFPLVKSISPLTMFFLILCSIGLASHAASGVTCLEQGGVEVCVQAKGPCQLPEIMPRERLPLELEMLLVTVSNKSGRRVGVDPENFVGITEDGQAVKLDRHMLQSIELRTVLRKKDLGPGEETKGHLFFPTWMGPIRTLLHRGSPSFKVNLY